MNQNMKEDTMDWLHFIGKSYYPTPHAFSKEAEAIGASRRISGKDAMRMRWGDTIYCAMMDGKSPVIFGYFTVDAIAGLAKPVINALPTHPFIPNDFTAIAHGAGHTVKRGCGSYTVVSVFMTNTPISQIVDSTTKGIMVQGRFYRFIFPIRLTNVKQRMGFRKFDYPAAATAATEDRAGNLQVRGHFYINEDTSEVDTLIAEMTGVLVEIEGYRKKA